MVNPSNRSHRNRLVIGLDEAGYGPNLGPLVVGGSAWLVPIEFTEAEIADAFRPGFSTKNWSPDCQHVPLGDSKKLYQSGSGLQTLEAGLMAMLRLLGTLPDNLAQLLHLVLSTGDDQLLLNCELPWYESLNKYRLPCCSAIDSEEISRMSARAAMSLADRQIELVAIRANVISEPMFNRRTHQLGSKARVLSDATLNLADQLTHGFTGLPVEYYCDRQGGRTNYLPMLLDWKPDLWFMETQRNSVRCSYRSNSEPEMHVHFTVGGDSFPATGLASMTAKYLRERLMESFNNYWQKHCQDLEPTAGYPADAKRFRQEILATASRLSLDEQLWWRCR